MKLDSKSQLILQLCVALLISVSGIISRADEGDGANAEDAVAEQSQTDDAQTYEAQQQTQRAPASLTPSSSPAAAARSPDFEDFLLSQDQDQPSDNHVRTLVQHAGNFGARTDSESFSRSELDNGPAIGMNYDRASALTQESGFMLRGMSQHFGERVIANNGILNLFERFSELRSESGVNLPAEFAGLVNFVEQYIRANDLQNSENTNGFSHHKLALQVVRASFCFGNDPFMILAKMRRETNFTRRSVSPTGAVGFSQMTSIGVREVQDQMSGNAGVSAPGAKAAFQQSIRCFSGISNYEIPSGSTESIKERISQKWGFDMVFGQILVKTLVSYAKTSQGYGNNTGGVVAAYDDAFTIYNGDTHITSGTCTKRKSVQMREEYACDVISQFNRMSAQWNRFVTHSMGKDLT